MLRHLFASRSYQLWEGQVTKYDWVGLFPDPVMANSALDRLVHHAHHLMIDEGESHRKKQSPKTRQ